MLSASAPIGVFDSGLGGLTVARAIADALPHESIYYLGDTERCPYGVRSEGEVCAFSVQAGRWLRERGVKLVVIACNTATAASLPTMQRLFDVPVIGVIAPGARAAIHSTHTRRVGVLATELTVRSGAYTRAIHNLDAGTEVYGCAASGFVGIVEGELLGTPHVGEHWQSSPDVFDVPDVAAEVGRTVAPLAAAHVDTVVLGCTHFPLLAGPISRALGNGVRVVSSAEETTHELEDILRRRELLADGNVVPAYRFATTSADIAQFAAAGSYIFGRPLTSVEHVDVSMLSGLY